MIRGALKKIPQSGYYSALNPNQYGLFWAEGARVRTILAHPVKSILVDGFPTRGLWMASLGILEGLWVVVGVTGMVIGAPMG